MVNDLLFYAIMLVCFVVVIVLVTGLGNFAKGGKDAGKMSNRMMRYRIVAQAVAVALIVILIILRNEGGN